MIIVYGGSFNPPTKAHLEIINKLNDNFKPFKIIVLPTGNNYTWKNNLIDFHDRSMMLELMLKSIKNIEISDIENNQNFLGTYHTLNTIKKMYENQKIYFVLGTDNLTKFDKWLNINELLTDFSFIIIKRPGFKLDLSLLDKFRSQYKVLDFDSEVSSTLIRTNLKKYKHWLTNDVYEYISNKDLYKGDKIWHSMIF